MILLVGGSLGAGPARCDHIPWLDAGPGPGSASGPGSTSGLHAIPDSDADPAGQHPSPARTPPPPVPPPTRTPPTPTAPPISTTPRRDEPTAREAHTPPTPPPAPHVVIPDEIVTSALRTLQPTLAACWRRAQRNDPALVSARIRLSLEVDAAGAVTASRTDAEDPKLGRCLSSVARHLAFPALGRPAAFDVPLYF